MSAAHLGHGHCLSKISTCPLFCQLDKLKDDMTESLLGVSQRHWHLIHSRTSDLGGHVHGIVKGKAEIPKHNCLTNGSACSFAKKPVNGIHPADRS
ncbi:putative cystathionine beta-lyase [Trichinella pseudospiralis]